jgi:tetratricopeptide (TPR) repeat protein
MSDKTTNNLFIDSSTPRFYQRLLKGAVTYGELGNRITRAIKAAHAFRQIDTVRELASILINNPIREYQLIAEYYLVWCQFRDKRYDIEALERISEQTQTYKIKALSSRAAIEVYQGNVDAALHFYMEALKASPTISEYAHISRAIAVIKAQAGYHKTAVKDLEQVVPILRHAEPAVCFDILNSYAVELGEVGRKSEARNVIKLSLASPYAWAYPEWQQTGEDLRPASRSFIVPDSSPVRVGKLLNMPQAERSEAERQDRPARVISLQEWKMKTAKDKTPTDKPAEDRPQNKSERVMYIMNHITAELTDEELDSIIERIDEVHAKKGKK